MTDRIFCVSGTDDLGDVHIFRTDDPARAKAVQEIFRSVLLDTELVRNPTEEMAQPIRLCATR